MALCSGQDAIRQYGGGQWRKVSVSWTQQHFGIVAAFAVAVRPPHYFLPLGLSVSFKASPRKE